MANLKKITDEPISVGTVVFRDTLYTSRCLFLPDGRQLAVAQARLSVEPGDTVALDYLNKHPDLQQQE